MKKFQKIDDKIRIGLLDDFNKGDRIVDLVSKYRVSSARIYQILAELNAMGKKVQYRVR